MGNEGCGGGGGGNVSGNDNGNEVQHNGYFLPILSLTPKRSLKKRHIENDLLLVFRKRRFCLDTKSKCQYDNEGAPSKSLDIQKQSYKMTRTFKLVSARLTFISRAGCGCGPWWWVVGRGDDVSNEGSGDDMTKAGTAKRSEGRKEGRCEGKIVISRKGKEGW